MAAPAVRPNSVQAFADLSAEERNRHDAVWREMEMAINQSPQIPDDNRQAVLEAAANTINDFAMNRGFYSPENAQAVGVALMPAAPAEINVVVKPIIQQPESVWSIAKKTLISGIFGTLGWQIASQCHPVVGVAIGAAGLIANRENYRRATANCYGN
jgi:hypothetical protein